ANLIANPQLANDPEIAAALLAAFLKDKERRIRNALLVDDLKEARKAVNGGTHGLKRFRDAFTTGQQLTS
ncbi:peptidoglycan-binding protein, partial [Leptolyngbya cf. ectocarpi LEGE 11479]